MRRNEPKASPRGRHILSSANTISSLVKPENFPAVVETVREFGWCLIAV